MPVSTVAQAIERFCAAGRNEDAAEAAVELARVSWFRGERDAAHVHIDQALDLTEDRPASRARANALVARSDYHMLAGEYPRAIELGRRALPVVDELGIGQLRARLLDVIGISRALQGDAEGLADSELAIAVAREAGDAFELIVATKQVLAPTLALRARILYACGYREEAASLVSDLLAHGHRLVTARHNVPAGEALIAFTWLAGDLGRADDLLPALEAAPRTPWVEAVLAVVRADPVTAADTLAGLGDRPTEAYTRFRAAEQLARGRRRRDMGAQLAQALAFYRSVGATRYIRESEALLAACV